MKLTEFPEFRRMQAYPSKMDMHMHTKWTDGKDSVRAMYDAACARELQLIAFTEHVRASSADWFPHFAAEVRGLPRAPCRALVAVETKITDFDGNLDISKEIADCCDVIVASVHRFPGEEGISARLPYAPEQLLDIEHRLARAALENPIVDVLGHPFAMAISRFSLDPPEKLMRDLIERAADKNIAFEINAKYHKNAEVLLRWCRDAGALVTFGSDAHRAAEIGRTMRQSQGGCKNG